MSDLPPSRFAELLARDIAGEDITEGRRLEPVVWAKTKKKRARRARTRRSGSRPRR